MISLRCREEAEGGRQKAESRRQKAESRRQKAESRRRKAESRRQKARKTAVGLIESSCFASILGDKTILGGQNDAKRTQRFESLSVGLQTGDANLP
jgi:hypothetical protein